MIKSRRGQINTYIIVIALLVAVILIAAVGLGKLALPDWLNNIIPGFGTSSNNGEISDLGCPVKIGVLEGRLISFCDSLELNEGKRDCASFELKSLILDGDTKTATISSHVGSFSSVGVGIVSKGRIVVNPEMLAGEGSGYLKALSEPGFPSHTTLVNLQGAYFSGKDICRESLVTIKDAGRSISTAHIDIADKTYYFDMNALLGVGYSSLTPVYSDASLSDRSKAAFSLEMIDENIRKHESIGGGTGTQTILGKFSNFFEDKIILKGGAKFEHSLLDETSKQSKWIKLETPINNKKGEIGFDTSGDSLVEVQFMEVYGAWCNKVIFIKFRDADFWSKKEETSWIMMDYWNFYENFAQVPSELTLDFLLASGHQQICAAKARE